MGLIAMISIDSDVSGIFPKLTGCSLISENTVYEVRPPKGFSNVIVSYMTTPADLKKEEERKHPITNKTK